MHDATYTFRPVTPADAVLLAQHRAEMFLDMGRLPPEDAEPFIQASIPWFQRMLDTREYVGWLVMSGDQIVGGGGIHVRDLSPIPGTYRMSRWGHIINIFTAPEHRRRGLARIMMKIILDWAKAEKLERITLTAAPAARPLYESLGFTATADMELTRKPEA